MRTNELVNYCKYTEWKTSTVELKVGSVALVNAYGTNHLSKVSLISQVINHTVLRGGSCIEIHRTGHLVLQYVQILLVAYAATPSKRSEGGYVFLKSILVFRCGTLEKRSSWYPGILWHALQSFLLRSTSCKACLAVFHSLVLPFGTHPNPLITALTPLVFNRLQNSFLSDRSSIEE